MTTPSSTDTIAAVATAPGEAGIAIVRISGSGSLEIADTVFRSSEPPPSQRSAGTFVYGHVRDSTAGPRAAEIDEVILLIYRAPHSYTREDVVEIQGHGGRACATRILRAALKAGARAAEPGEFTRRAFLNGRIDLLQAEAVADLIQAKSERAASIALEQLDGSLSRLLGDVYEKMMGAAADLEATLDFAEEELPSSTRDEIIGELQAVGRELRRVLDTWEEGHLLREGAVVAICGRPNVGKSTLLNKWLGAERAIVTPSPGTTRDTIEEQVILNGIPVRLVDTAGLREAECHVEQQGVERAQAAMKSADVIVYLVDASQPLEQEEIEVLRRLSPGQSALVLNKTDVGNTLEPEALPFPPVVACSLLNDEGLPEITAAVSGLLGMPATDIPHAAISERHRQSIQNALNVLNVCLATIRTGKEDQTALAASSLRTALEHIGEITGRCYSTELLDNIFGRFCVGK